MPATSPPTSKRSAIATVGTGKLDLNFVNEGPIYESNDWADAERSISRSLPRSICPRPSTTSTIASRLRSRECSGSAKSGIRRSPRRKTSRRRPTIPDHQITRQEWARYLNSVSGTDVRIGWILDQLKQDGLADNTVIIFFARQRSTGSPRHPLVLG